MGAIKWVAQIYGAQDAIRDFQKQETDEEREKFVAQEGLDRFVDVGDHRANRDLHHVIMNLLGKIFSWDEE